MRLQTTHTYLSWFKTHAPSWSHLVFCFCSGLVLFEICQLLQHKLQSHYPLHATTKQKQRTIGGSWKYRFVWKYLAHWRLHIFVIHAWPWYWNWNILYDFTRNDAWPWAFPRRYVDVRSIVFSWVRWFVPFHNKIRRCRADQEMVRFVNQRLSTVACILYPEKDRIVSNMTYVWFKVLV